MVPPLRGDNSVKDGLNCFKELHDGRHSLKYLVDWLFQCYTSRSFLNFPVYHSCQALLLWAFVMCCVLSCFALLCCSILFSVVLLGYVLLRFVVLLAVTFCCVVFFCVALRCVVLWCVVFCLVVFCCVLLCCDMLCWGAQYLRFCSSWSYVLFNIIPIRYMK